MVANTNTLLFAWCLACWIVVAFCFTDLNQLNLYKMRTTQKKKGKSRNCSYCFILASQWWEKNSWRRVFHHRLPCQKKICILFLYLNVLGCAILSCSTLKKKTKNTQATTKTKKQKQNDTKQDWVALKYSVLLVKR